MAKMKTLTINGKTYELEDADSVSYGEKQELTPEQQERARRNIGAAAAGEGVGGGASEEAILSVLVDLGIAPVLLDAAGSVLADGDGAVLVNN